MINKPKILIIADVKGWIFERHALYLKDNLSNFYEISIIYKDEVPSIKENLWDLIYPLEWNLITNEIIQNSSKWVTGIRSHVSWEDYGIDSVGRFLREKYSMVHTVSLRLYELFKNYHPDLYVLTHGLNIEHFSTDLNISNKTGEIKVGWAGNRAGLQKGFDDFIKPLENIPGINLNYCGYSNTLLDYKNMRLFYEEIDIYICTSISEGNNNSLMEAAAMGRAIITTDVGTVPEYLEQGYSALIVDRKFESIKYAVELLRDNPRLRLILAKNAKNSVRKFSWSNKITEYRQFFDIALNKVNYNPLTNS